MPDPMPDTGPTCTELLDADTVMTTAGPGLYYGYGTIAIFNASAGTLLPNNTFELNSITYTIVGLIGLNLDGADGLDTLYFKVDVGVIPEKDDLVLQLDSREFAFSDAGYKMVSSDAAYVWEGLSTDLSWSAADETVPVKLCVNE